MEWVVAAELFAHALRPRVEVYRSRVRRLIGGTHCWKGPCAAKVMPRIKSNSPFDYFTIPTVAAPSHENRLTHPADHALRRASR